MSKTSRAGGSTKVLVLSRETVKMLRVRSHVRTGAATPANPNESLIPPCNALETVPPICDTVDITRPCHE
jgi:hypothetical protein